MTEHTPEKVAELVAEARKLLFSDSAFGYEDTKEGDLIFRLADALAAVSAERDELRSRVAFAAAIVSGDATFERYEELERATADRDRLHKAITEALAGLELSAEPDWPGWNVLTGTENILRAALDKEGSDDE